ncbi:MAG: transketolase [Planctomycetes bacterium]|nr:transketolase [Planctomycetota bacterium]
MSSATPTARLEDLAVNTIRVLSMEAVQKANSGHPGLPMGCAEISYVLFTRHLKFDPKDPSRPDRDRLDLTAVHGSMLLYSLLHLTGYDLPLSEIQRFRQLGSHTPGHPEYGDTAGVETTTGPLGQGFANAVGMALAEALLAARFNTPEHKVVDHHTYVLASDGDLMEGISHEAASLAGHLRLGKLICVYDDNLISLDGPTKMAFSEDVERRFQAYGWHTQRVDGHDRAAVDRALEAARAETGRPSIVLARTVLGKGSPNKSNTHEAHGSPLGPEEVELTRKGLGWTHPPLTVPEEVRPIFAAGAERGARLHAEWRQVLAAWESRDPEKAALRRRTLKRELPAGWREKLPRFSAADKPIATRAASGKVINALADVLPELIGGSADLASSNVTAVAGKPAVSAEDRSGRNLWFGVREHAMGAVLNGLCLHGGLRPYGGTFLVFSDYLRPAIRLAALMRQPVIYVFTHDSVFLGEDGPTHQPVEHIAALRAIPNLRVIRPADANETAAAWAQALERTDGPTALVLSRQNLPVCDETALGKGAERGGYVLEKEEGGPADVALIATGSEVSLARDAARLLRGKGLRVRVVSLPSWDLFDAQPEAYRASVLPREIRRRVAIEAASPFGWERYTGEGGLIQGIRRFGASAPLKDLQRHFGFTPEAVAEAVERHVRG